MNTTTIVLANAALAVAVIGSLAAAASVALRLRPAPRAETLHPSQPIALRLATHGSGEDRPLSRAA
jgi:hypothetical protein